MISTKGYLNRFVWRKINKNWFKHLIHIITQVKTRSEAFFNREVSYKFNIIFVSITLVISIITLYTAVISFMSKEEYFKPKFEFTGVMISSIFIFIGFIALGWGILYLTTKFLDKIEVLYRSLQTDIP